MGGDNQADRAIHAGEFFDGRGIFDVAETSTALLFGENDAEKAHFGELRNNFAGKAGSFVPLHDVRSDFTFGKFTYAAAELILFIGKSEVHEASFGQRMGSAQRVKEMHMVEQR